MRTMLWLCALTTLLIAAVWIDSSERYADNNPQGLVSRMPADFADAVKADKERSRKWPSVRKHFLLTHNFCAYCGGTEKLQVHHIRPFHLHPELELDETNMITLCELPETDHHLHIGHLGNFRSEGNPDVVKDCQAHEATMKADGSWPTN